MENKDLLDKWLNDELSPAEFEVFRTLPEFSSYQKIDAFAKRMQVPEWDHDAGKADLTSRIQKRKPGVGRTMPIRSILRIAAVITLLAAGYFYFTSLDTTVHTGLAETSSLQLPDDSNVLLNEDSELVYNGSDWKESRDIQLNGEAYFEVAKGTTFRVITTQGIVTVLGTKFNVKASDGQFLVSCYEGKVSVTHEDKKIVLTAGQTARLKENEFLGGEIFTSRPEWIANESSFDDQPLPIVIQELEKHYNITVTTENIDVNLRFTGSFARNDLDAALQSITIPLKLSYRIEDPNVVILFTETLQE